MENFINFGVSKMLWVLYTGRIFTYTLASLVTSTLKRWSQIFLPLKQEV